MSLKLAKSTQKPARATQGGPISKKKKKKERKKERKKASKQAKELRSLRSQRAPWTVSSLCGQSTPGSPRLPES